MSNFIDLTGQRFGKVVALEHLTVLQGNSKTSCWKVACDCGKIFVRSSADLRKGKVMSCGCDKSNERPNRRIDISGQKFGRLTALRFVRMQGHNSVWLFRCDCGREVEIVASNVRNGHHTQSCGCLQRETIKAIATKHGGEKTRLYKIFRDMVNRCYDKKDKGYHNYGGRGIVICDVWKNDYGKFMKWAYANGYDENAPRGKYTIDRIDVNGNYEPSNCRWVDMKTQCNNTRFNLRYIVYGEDLTLKQIAEKYNVNYHTLYGRVRLLGWDIYDALNLPKGTITKVLGETFRKKVVRIEDGKQFVSVHEAATQMKCSNSLICMACNGKVKTALGYHWQYA